MTVKIALFLSSDGIALAHRQPAGHWAMIGETALDVPDLSASLADLRTLAVEREGDPFETLVVLPDDQILYTSLTAPTADPDLTAYRIEDGLEGLTPYSVTELEYDWRALEEDRVKIAVVARETLDEARNFAAQYGFTTKGFAAMPPMERFPGVPTFDLGNEAAAMGFTADGIAFGPDSFGQPEPVAEPEPDPTPVVEAAPEPDVSPEPEPVFEPEPPVAELGEPTLEPAAPDIAEPILPEPVAAEPPTPEPVAPTPTMPDAVAPAPEDYNPALADALHIATGIDHGNDDTPSPQAIEDPSVSGPIASIAPEAERVDAAPSTPSDPAQEVIGDAGEDDSLPPAPSLAVLAARQRARTKRDGTLAAKEAAPVAPPPPIGDAPSSTGQFTASRGPTAAPSGVDRSITAPDGSGGPVPAPAAARGALIGQRSSRLGLAHPDGPARAAPTPTPAPVPAPAAPAGDAAPMPRLAEQLQRVRNASKTRPSGPASTAPQPPRPRVEITPQPVLGATGASASRRPSPFDKTPSAGATSASKKGRLAGLLKRPNGGASDSKLTPEAGDASKPSRGGLLRGRAKTAKTATPAPATTAGDETFASGLLARKSAKPTGGSFRTGLVLTVILLLLLALVAIWSAVFLPNSTVARLFGMGSSDTVVASTGVPAPNVTTAIPAIGAVDPTASALQPSLEDEAAADGMDLTADDPSILIETPVADADQVVVAAADPATALPDIDADLDLPPLPVIDQGQNPSLEEAEALYAEDGIWARSPERPDLRPFDLLDRVYTASIDPEVSAFDAVALPDPGVNPGELLRRFPPPPAFGTEFDLTDSGLIAPTPDGVLTPEGAFVISGVPPRVAVPRPREVVSTAPAVEIEDAALGAVRPAERPGDLAETRERQILGGLTEVELSARRPAARPDSPQEAAAQASLFPGGDGAADPDAVDAAVEQALQGTELAIARSILPNARPSNIAQIVASADRTPTEATTTVAVAASAVASGPSIPSNADVSRAATETNVIRLRNVNLIGVSGTPSDRRALVRLASGRIVRVTVGDRLDGGRVAAVGETTLQYVRSGRTVTLEIPS